MLCVIVARALILHRTVNSKLHMVLEEKYVSVF